MMIATTISSGVFSSLTGVLMKWELNMFYYSVFAFSLAFFGCAKSIVATLREESQLVKDWKGTELPLIGERFIG
jgi:hypothetical protein